jgi:hypothetical protein
MENRETAISKQIEYETKTCIHCGDEIVVGDRNENVDGLPKGVTLVVGGGEHMSVEQTDRRARMKDYRTPKIVIKWFLQEETDDLLQQYMCRSCAESVYGFSP